MKSAVLCFSGLDPSGGAGLQADIESIRASGSYASSICTALTIQSSQKVFGFESIPPQLLAQQAQHVMSDLPITTIKSGMLGDVETAQVIATICERRPDLKYVLDPVMMANSGDALGDSEQLVLMLKTLIPFATIITPNTHELFMLTQQKNVTKAVKVLLSWGAKAVLVKGAHLGDPNKIEHLLFEGEDCTSWTFWPRLSGEYHGSGCSLASYIAGLLAQGVALRPAVQTAEAWLHKVLLNAYRPHESGQRIPRR